jgi:hypothetical protein
LNNEIEQNNQKSHHEYPGLDYFADINHPAGIDYHQFTENQSGSSGDELAASG